MKLLLFPSPLLLLPFFLFSLTVIPLFHSSSLITAQSTQPNYYNFNNNNNNNKYYNNEKEEGLYEYPIQTGVYASYYYNNDNETVLQCTLAGKELTCNNGLIYEQKEQKEDEGWQLWLNILMCIFTVLFAGLMSGLTMGLMSMDMMNLKIVQKSGSETARKHATKIMPLVEKHHLLLVTLLIGNSLAMEALPIFLDRIIGSIGAILISVTMVLLFGDKNIKLNERYNIRIIPQAICTRYGLAIGAYLSWLVWLLIFVFFVIAYPVSKLLDWILGKETGTTYRRAELKELVDIHERGECHHDDSNTDSLSQEEVSIIKQVLDLKIKLVEDVMTPLQAVSLISYNDVIDIDYVFKLMMSGRSKWPVFMKKRENVVGIITLQMILESNFKERVAIASFTLLRIPTVHQKLNLNEMLSVFQKGSFKMALVVDHFDCVTLLGIITITDLLKELFGQLNIRERTFTSVSNQVKAVKALNDDEKHRHYHYHPKKENSDVHPLITF